MISHGKKIVKFFSQSCGEKFTKFFEQLQKTNCTSWASKKYEKYCKIRQLVVEKSWCLSVSPGKKFYKFVSLSREKCIVCIFTQFEPQVECLHTIQKYLLKLFKISMHRWSVLNYFVSFLYKNCWFKTHHIIYLN